MPASFLYNYHDFQLPEAIPELLDLLGFWAYWDRKETRWRIYERLSAISTDSRRMKWLVQEFGGGTTEEWQKFLSTITGAEYVR